MTKQHVTGPFEIRSGLTRSRKEIMNRIAFLEKDERLKSPTANILINAPLALIQLSLAVEIGGLLGKGPKGTA